MTINAVAENNTYSLAHRSGVQKSRHRVTGQVSVGLTAFLSAETGEKSVLKWTWPNSVTSGYTTEVQFLVVVDPRSPSPYWLSSCGCHSF